MTVANRKLHPWADSLAFYLVALVFGGMLLFVTQHPGSLGSVLDKIPAIALLSGAASVGWLAWVNHPQGLFKALSAPKPSTDASQIAGFAESLRSIQDQVAALSSRTEKSLLFEARLPGPVRQMQFPWAGGDGALDILVKTIESLQHRFETDVGQIRGGFQGLDTRLHEFEQNWSGVVTQLQAQQGSASEASHLMEGMLSQFVVENREIRYEIEKSRDEYRYRFEEVLHKIGQQSTLLEELKAEIARSSATNSVDQAEIEPLSQIQMSRLAIKGSHGDSEAIQTLFAELMPLVVELASQSAAQVAPRVNTIDLVDAGVRALVMLIRDYDPVIEEPFGVLAREFILEKIAEAIENTSEVTTEELMRSIFGAVELSPLQEDDLILEDIESETDDWSAS